MLFSIFVLYLCPSLKKPGHFQEKDSLMGQLSAKEREIGLLKDENERLVATSGEREKASLSARNREIQQLKDEVAQLSQEKETRTLSGMVRHDSLLARIEHSNKEIAGHLEKERAMEAELQKLRDFFKAEKEPLQQQSGKATVAENQDEIRYTLPFLFGASACNFTS